AAAGAAHVLTDRDVERWPAVERDDARVADHLVADRDGPRMLRDAHAVAVDHRQDRAEHGARDAAVVEVAVREGVEPPRSERAAAARRRQREARGCLLGHASVRRIDHERRVAERAHAPFVLQKRALRGGLAAALIRACALRELLRRETRARAETLR